MLRRLEIGLVDEGCRVIRVHPQGAFDEPTTALAAAVSYVDSAWRVWAMSPARSVERALADAALFSSDPDESPVDVIHAFGETCWPTAVSLSLALGADLVLEVWSRRALSLIPQYEKRTAAFTAADLSMIWLAPDRIMSEAAARIAGRWPVLCSRWGVHVPPPDAARLDRIESVCILSSGAEPASLLNLLTTLAGPGAAAPENGPMIFLDARAVEGCPTAWRQARSTGLLSRLTLLPDMESRRQLVLRSDVLVVPDSLGEHRTLTLEAMAAGMVVVARADRLVEATADAGRAVVVEEPSEAGWKRALDTVMSDAALTRAVAAAGRGYIEQHRLAHQQVRATLEAYTAFLRERPIPLGGPRGRRDEEELGS